MQSSGVWFLRFLKSSEKRKFHTSKFGQASGYKGIAQCAQITLWSLLKYQFHSVGVNQTSRNRFFFLSIYSIVQQFISFPQQRQILILYFNRFHSTKLNGKAECGHNPTEELELRYLHRLTEVKQHLKNNLDPVPRWQMFLISIQTLWVIQLGLSIAATRTEEQVLDSNHRTIKQEIFKSTILKKHNIVIMLYSLSLITEDQGVQLVSWFSHSTTFPAVNLPVFILVHPVYSEPT